jgi:hypothetical protein
MKNKTIVSFGFSIMLLAFSTPAWSLETATFAYG